MKQAIQTQLLNLSEEKQKELYELTVAVRTQLAKENKKLSLTYMNLKNKRNEFIRINMPNIERIDRVVVGTIWATLYNKFY